MVSTQEASLRGRIGGYALASQHNPREYTKNARAAFLGAFEKKVGPDGTLPKAERERRALAARRAHFTRMALASAKARRRGIEAPKNGGSRDA